MAGTFTHFLIAEEALERARGLPSTDPLCAVSARLNQRKCFLLQGAISPDYPFLAERLPPGLRAVGNWGNRMHSENTGAVVDAGLKLLCLRAGDEHDTCLAWLWGYATHLVADTVIHPIVNLAVGGVAPFTETEHGECEITQDTWIFDRIRGCGIAQGSAEYVQSLRDCSDPTDPDSVNPFIHGFWRDCLKAAHPVSGATKQEFQLAYASIVPHAWHRALLALLPVAAKPGGVLRYVGGIVHLRERMYDKLSRVPDDHLERYVRQLDSPDGSHGTASVTFERVFSRAVDQTVVMWQRMAKDLESLVTRPECSPQPYPNWDLDTGMEMPTWGLTCRSGLGRLALWS
jgi:hypothetical protein